MPHTPLSSDADGDLLARTQAYLKSCREEPLPPSDSCSSAWDEFYARFDPVVRWAVRACRPTVQEPLEDCAQEAWLEIVRKLVGFRYDPARGSVRAWLSTLVRRRTRRALRRTGRGASPLAGLDASLLCRRADAAQDCQHRERRQAVHCALERVRDRLGPTAGQVVALHALRGRPLRAVAFTLGLTLGQARHHWRRAKIRLRRELAGHS